MFQPAERITVKDTIPVPLEIGAQRVLLLLPVPPGVGRKSRPVAENFLLQFFTSFANQHDVPLEWRTSWLKRLRILSVSVYYRESRAGSSGLANSDRRGKFWPRLGRLWPTACGRRPERALDSRDAGAAMKSPRRLKLAIKQFIRIKRILCASSI